MAKVQTISLALIEADAAISVLASALGDKLNDTERHLIERAREALAVAEGRLNDAKALANDAASRL